jgi:hypothetical protein
MAPVPPIPCTVPGCGLSEDGDQYWTDNHCASYAEARQLMRDHIEVHKLADAALDRVRDDAKLAAALLAPPLVAGPPGLAPQRNHIEKISRPTITEGTDDIQWEGFVKKFTRYKRVTGVMGQAATDQLWYCMSETLEDAVSQDGTAEDITEVLLLAKIKSLAVRRANVMVNQAKFLRLSQHKDEDCGAFVSRLRGAAQVSNFIHECSHCNRDVSYSERMIAHQLVVALADETIQEKVLTQVANQTPTLLELTTMVEALETGKRSTLALQEGKTGPGSALSSGSANRLSEYQKTKQGKGRGPPGPLGVVKPQTSPPAVLGGPSTGPSLCGWCGDKAHGEEPKDRLAACKAINSNCLRCGKIGHYAKVCKSPLPTVATLTEDVTTAQVHENYEGSFFFMRAERRKKWKQSRDARKGSGQSTNPWTKCKKQKRGTPGALGGGPDQPPGGPGGTEEIAVAEQQPEDRRNSPGRPTDPRYSLEEEEEQRRFDRTAKLLSDTYDDYWNYQDEQSLEDGTAVHRPMVWPDQGNWDGAPEPEHNCVSTKDDRSATERGQEQYSQGPKKRFLKTWLGPNLSNSRLPEAELRGNKGTPGALGGGPDQPPGGPGGTRQDQRYSDHDQEGAQDQPEVSHHYHYRGSNYEDDEDNYEEDRLYSTAGSWF